MKKGIIATSCLAAALMIGGRVFAAPPAGDAEKGKAIFEDNCAVCHNADSDEKKMGPGLKGVTKKDKLKNGKKPTDANIKAIINAGGNGMPPYSDMLSDEERDNVLAYLKTL
ncbi:MAG TPA: cytochrome c [Bryobacteraceae bacterium]|jgi:cytochrome c|nr:cytochrome c [Bryobacteraceae bacterium]